MASIAVGVFAYNQAAFVRIALESVATQTHRPDKVLVFDDGSSDSTVQTVHRVVSELELDACTVVADGENHGLSARLNQFLDAVDSDWVLILAADDLLTPNCLEALKSGITDGVDVVFGNLERIREDGTSLGYSRPRDTWQRRVARRYRSPKAPLPDMFTVNNFVPGGMCLIRRTAAAEAGGWSAEAKTEDYDLWLRIGWTSRFRYVDDVVGRYRVVAGSTSRSERANTLDQAYMARRLRGTRATDRQLARLVAMRWGLSVGRTRFRPGVSLAELAEASSLPQMQLVLALPQAVMRPIAGSAIAAVRLGFVRLSGPR